MLIYVVVPNKIYGFIMQKKIEFQHYELVPHMTMSSSRFGALLRVQFDDDSVGYADCHPWEELGDLCLRKQLQLLLKGKTTPLTQQSLYFARIDANARSKNENLFKDLKIPSSHYLITNIIHCEEKCFEDVINQGFTHIKIKLGRNLKSETKILTQWIKHSSINNLNLSFRLDFNAQISENQFLEFLQEISPWKHRIDFFEDPFSWNPSIWNSFQSNHKITLACDHQSHLAIGDCSNVDVLVFKPAVQNVETLFRQHDILKQRVVITSYLDHPLGQLCAAYTAAKLKESYPKIDVCGLTTHRVYQTTDFSSQLGSSNPFLSVPQGTGFGFDDLLIKQKWIGLDKLN